MVMPYTSNVYRTLRNSCLHKTGKHFFEHSKCCRVWKWMRTFCVFPHLCLVAPFPFRPRLREHSASPRRPTSTHPNFRLPVPPSLLCLLHKAERRGPAQPWPHLTEPSPWSGGLLSWLPVWPPQLHSCLPFPSHKLHSP